MIESWARMPGSDRFEISSLGDFRRVGSHRNLVPCKAPNGYLKAHLWSGGIRRTVSLHRMVAEAFIGPCPNGKEVNHKDGNKTNNAISNLEYVTRSENLRHYAAGLGKGRIRQKGSIVGRQVRGAKHPQAKLTESQVVDIVRRHANGERVYLIARQFGVSRTAISNVVHGHRWKHVQTSG